MMNIKPTKENLQTIREWDSVSLEDSIALIKYIEKMWWTPGRGIIFIDYQKSTRRSGWELELHTLGWSGNEAIVKALDGSKFWNLYWQKSERGGHYYFQKEDE